GPRGHGGHCAHRPENQRTRSHLPPGALKDLLKRRASIFHRQTRQDRRLDSTVPDQEQEPNDRSHVPRTVTPPPAEDIQGLSQRGNPLSIKLLRANQLRLSRHHRIPPKRVSPAGRWASFSTATRIVSPAPHFSPRTTNVAAL